MFLGVLTFTVTTIKCDQNYYDVACLAVLGFMLRVLLVDSLETVTHPLAYEWSIHHDFTTHRKLRRGGIGGVEYSFCNTLLWSRYDIYCIIIE